MVMAVGGSTNAVLHLIAMARAVDVPLTIDDFQTHERPRAVPGRPAAERQVRAGRFAPRRRHAGRDEAAARRKDCIDGDCLTITGKTIAENLADLPGLSKGQDVVHPSRNPIKATGHIRIMRGNFCPDGAVAKITGKEGLKFTGTANCFDSEEDMLAAMQQQEDQEGRRGGHSLRRPARRTRHARDALAHRRDHGRRPGKDVALITDGRFSGGSAGFIVGHVTPEAQLGGPIALVQNGDRSRSTPKPTRSRSTSRPTNSPAAAKPGTPRPTKPPAARSTSTSRT